MPFPSEGLYAHGDNLNFPLFFPSKKCPFENVTPCRTKPLSQNKLIAASKDSAAWST